MITRNDGEHFRKVYRDLERDAQTLSIRGQLVRELCNYSFVIPPYEYMTNFEPRNFNLAYCKAEWHWYLKADRYDRSIEQYASMWKKIRTTEGGYNSNYGQYIFGQGQFDWVLGSLIRDENTRQASMQLLNQSHMYGSNPDVVCTHGINFRIRNNTLDMTVMMRSNDAIFGMTNDVFCFGQLHMYILEALKAITGVQYKMGNYTHFVCSMHVYERHFDMLAELADSDCKYTDVVMPLPKSVEEFNVLRSREQKIPEGYEYANWIMQYEQAK